MAGGTALCGLAVFGMLALLIRGSIPYFWPADLALFEVLEDGETVAVAGKVVSRQKLTREYLLASGEEVPEGIDEVERIYLKVGNREINGLDFVDLLSIHLTGQATAPEQLIALERRQWGDFYGYLLSISEDGEPIASGGQPAWQRLVDLLPEVQGLHHLSRELEAGEISRINRQLEDVNQRLERAQQEGEEITSLRTLRDQQQAAYVDAERRLDELRERAQRFSLLMSDAAGEQQEINLEAVVRAYRPNTLGFWGKLAIALDKLGEFITDEPRESNTEGGVFPAIFGTVAMVLVMSVLVTPLGVLAAFYLHEYRRQGAFVRIIRVCINNLAGVPSIVFGIFGLGFFVYALGGSLDELFFSEKLPNPTLGTPGLFWASLTLALLTLPVVVVSTEEGLARVPSSIRQGALALGATRFEMLSRTVLPMAMPGILTGVILAIARAAGEVAPLMLVGAVKFAPDLPVSGEFPYIHLEQKFMHLGLHIYDAGFQSPNSEAALPLVYASSLMLVVVVVVLNIGAIWMRNNYRERFRALEV